MLQSLTWMNCKMTVTPSTPQMMTMMILMVNASFKGKYHKSRDNDTTLLADSSNDDVFGRRGGNRNQNAILSSSMPISVPHWRKARAISNVSDDEDSEKVGL